MKHLAFGVALIASPALAQDEGQGDFWGQLLEDAQPFLDNLEGFADQAGPQLRGFLEQMGPAFRDMMSKVEDWANYEAPEVLPNGDIIIRRKPDAPEYKAPEGVEI